MDKRITIFLRHQFVLMLLFVLPPVFVVISMFDLCKGLYIHGHYVGSIGVSLIIAGINIVLVGYACLVYAEEGDKKPW